MNHAFLVVVICAASFFASFFLWCFANEMKPQNRVLMEIANLFGAGAVIVFISEMVYAFVCGVWMS